MFSSVFIAAKAREFLEISCPTLHYIAVVVAAVDVVVPSLLNRNADAVVWV